MKSLLRPKTYLLVLKMVLFAIVGCSDWIDSPESSNPDLVEHTPAIVVDARHLLQQKGEFYLLNMMMRDGKHTAKSKANAISSKSLKLRWDKYHLSLDRSEEVVSIPIEGYHLTALSVLNVDGRAKKTQNKVTSKLIVRRGENNTLVAVIGTYVYDQNYARDYRAELDTMGYDFENSHFTGYFITSRLDGQMLLGYSLKKGKEMFAFRQNPHPKKADENQSIHLHLGFNSHLQMTRSSFAEQESSSAEKCESCDREIDDCRCAKVIVCGKCKKHLEQGVRCTCESETCRFCQRSIKLCNCCKSCGKLKHDCVCHNVNVGQPDNGNDNSNDRSSGNVNFGGQGGYDGVNYSDGGHPRNGEAVSKPNPFGLNKVYAFSKASMISQGNKTASLMKTLYGTTMAVCNFGVQNHFKQMFPNHRPPGMTGRANEMVRAWRKETKYWKRIAGRDLKETLQKVNEAVNAGLYVVAGWENPEKNRSGHVVVVMPGLTKYSDKYNADMPQIMDTGYERRGIYYLDKGFGSKKIPKVEFYYYKN